MSFLKKYRTYIIYAAITLGLGILSAIITGGYDIYDSFVKPALAPPAIVFPIVWTVHDCWLYTGHCYHYASVGCDKWKEQCSNCPQKKAFPTSYVVDRSKQNFLDKKSAFTSVKDITIVTVSDWMKGEMSSSFLKDCSFQVIHNGIDPLQFDNIPGKTEEDEGFINIGAVLRVTPIKDVKTMIRAFAFANEKLENLRLWIMGPSDEDEEYAEECFELVEQQKIPGVYFTGRVDVTKYLGRMDFTILTSISEGQPLTILESYAAKKPVIATDVGNCRGLIFGEDDDFGPAGILTHIMNVTEISEAIIELSLSPKKREEMGENGYKRVVSRYQLHQMRNKYEELYENIGWDYGCIYPEEEFDITLKK